MSMGMKIECPKCHNDRTMLENTFGLPGYIEPQLQPAGGQSINTTCAIPLRMVLCPRCHYVELYHDVGLGKLV